MLIGHLSMPRVTTFDVFSSLVFSFHAAVSLSCNLTLQHSPLLLRPHKKSLVYHPRPRLNSRPHRYMYFFICLIPHENKVYGFVFVVVMNHKSKKHDFPGFGE